MADRKLKFPTRIHPDDQGRIKGLNALARLCYGVPRSGVPVSSSTPIVLLGVFFAVTVSFLVLVTLSGCGASPPPKDKKSTPKAIVLYELVNVTIPPDSPHRKNTNLNQPPRLFVIMKRNGVQLGSASTEARGWSADFIRDDPKNQWEVSEGTDDRYTIEVWDRNLIRKNSMIFNLTSLKGEDFGMKMSETGPALVDKDRLAIIEWRKVEKTTGETKRQ
jgi:hypothetical protein